MPAAAEPAAAEPAAAEPVAAEPAAQPVIPQGREHETGIIAGESFNLETAMERAADPQHPRSGGPNRRKRTPQGTQRKYYQRAPHTEDWLRKNRGLLGRGTGAAFFEVSRHSGNSLSPSLPGLPSGPLSGPPSHLPPAPLTPLPSKAATSPPTPPSGQHPGYMKWFHAIQL